MLMAISRRKFITSGLVVVAGAVATDAFWIEKHFIEKKEFHIGSASSDKIRVIQVSDLHMQSLSDRYKQLTKYLNAQKPDLILFTGDSIDKRENTEVLESFLKEIDHNIQKVAILGNWEYWGNVDLTRLRKVYKDHNCELLINDTKQFLFRNRTISITGVDDLVGGNADIETALQGFKESDLHIVLNHCPEYYDVIVNYNKIKIDLVLAGHTHGGQLNLFGFTPFLPRGSGKYLKGWYKERSPNLYVSKGIGTSIIPARLGARAEVTLFNL
jgi:uncharacterized protein